MKTKNMKRPLVATLGYCINVYMLSGYAAFSSHWLLMLDGVPLSCLIDAVQYYTKNDLSCEERKCVAENAFALLMQKTKSIKKPSFLLQLIFCTFCCQKYSLVFSSSRGSKSVQIMSVVLPIAKKERVEARATLGLTKRSLYPQVS